MSSLEIPEDLDLTNLTDKRKLEHDLPFYFTIKKL